MTTSIKDLDIQDEHLHSDFNDQNNEEEIPVSRKEFNNGMNSINAELKAIYWMGSISCCAAVISAIGIGVSLFIFLVQETNSNKQILENNQTYKELEGKVEDIRIENFKMMMGKPPLDIEATK